MDGIISWLPELITRDFLRKLIALFFALLVWISVKNTIGVEEMLPGEIPVNFSLPAGFIMSNDDPQIVHIKVRASEKRLSRLSEQQFSANIHIKESQYKKDEPINIMVKPSDLTAPFGVTVVSVENPLVVAYLDRIISKNVKIMPQTNGGMEGYTKGKITLTPSEVTITGPRCIGAIKRIPNSECPFPNNRAKQYSRRDGKC